MIQIPGFSEYKCTFYIVGIVATCMWTVQRCDRVDISVDRIFGDLPKQVRWLKLTGLALAVTAFSVCSATVMFSLIYIYFPDFVKSLLASSSLNASQSSSLIQLPLLRSSYLEIMLTSRI